jgi:hypothetical protein
MEHSRLIGIIQQAAGYRTTEYAHRHNQQSGGGKGTSGNKDKKVQPAPTATSVSAAPAAAPAAAVNAGAAAPVSAKKPPLVVADMMAGVGPFAVPLAMPLVGTTNSVTTAERTIIVHANGTSSSV